MRRSALAVAFVLLLAGCGRRSELDSRILSDIAAELEHTRSIDNHAHPVSMDPGDREFDALPADAIQVPALPVPSKPDNPLFAEARDALKGAPGGDQHPIWILNHTDTEIMLANRVAMGRGLSGDRFKWVPFVDLFLFPLKNDAIKARDPEHAAFVRNEEDLLARYLAAQGLKTPPLGLEDYLIFVTHTLEKFKSDGAVALKFELAYLRDLDIGNWRREDVERIYTVYVGAAEPSEQEYRALQDYLFRYIALEAGRLGLSIHIHSSIGAGSYFRQANANPLALEGVLNDPVMRKTKFVLLHGAWPFTREAGTLILKPNVYLDYSGWSYMTYPAEAARHLRYLLEMAPDKVLYGSDASPLSDKIGWEETAWTGSRTGRQTLGLAVTGMVQDGEISVEQGKKLVHMVLRDNARKLYGL